MDRSDINSPHCRRLTGSYLEWEMIVPDRRRKRPYVLPVVAAIAVAAPLVTAYSIRQPDSYRPANDNGVAAVPARMAEVALAAAPDVTLPLRELTGLNLPDLHLSDLRKVPLPTAIQLPPGLPPIMPGLALPSQIPLPQFDGGPAAPTTPRNAAPATSGAPTARVLPGPVPPPVPTPPAPGAPPAVGVPAGPGTARSATNDSSDPVVPNSTPNPGGASTTTTDMSSDPAAASTNGPSPTSAAPTTTYDRSADRVASPSVTGAPSPYSAGTPSAPGTPTPSPAGTPAAPGAPHPSTAGTPSITGAPTPYSAGTPSADNTPTPYSAGTPSITGAPTPYTTTTPSAAELPAAYPAGTTGSSPGPAAAPAVTQSNPAAGAISGERLRAAPGAGSAAGGSGGPVTTTIVPDPAGTAGRSRAADSGAVIPAGADPNSPALAPGALPPELADRVGATVKELSRDTPFSLVAFTAKDLAGTTTLVRAKQADGGWGPWYATDRVDTRRSDHLAPSADDRTGTEPIYVGETKAVQVLVTRGATTPVDARVATPRRQDLASDGVGVVLPEMHSAPSDYPLAPEAAAAPPNSLPASHDTAGPESSDPAIVPNLPEYQRDPSDALSSAPASDDPSRTLAAVLIDPGRGLIDENLSTVATALPGGGPRVISRAQWGADESLRCSEPTYDDGVSAITVHHTAGRTEYTQAESAGIVRAIYAYHARKLGWCDIGYNALVDKYGQIFEGRAGGLDRPVEGAHAGGFNENTSGVALMGNYSDEAPSEAALQAVGQFIGWRARMAGLNPKGSTTLYSEGTIYSKYDQGEAVKLPIVFAHRDVGNTSCPGDAAYAQMDRIRDLAAAAAASPGGDADPPTNPANVGVAFPPLPPPPAGAPARMPGPQTDLTALAELTTRLLGLVNDNIIARYWSGQGGPNGRLGAAASEPRRTSDGGQYARFVNGYVYARPDGQVVEVVGRLMDRFLQLGAEAGVLGLPTRNAYAVPDGLRSDFQYGSLILNQLTGIVTTLVSYYAEVSQRSADPAGAARGQAPRAAPDPAAPNGAPAPGATAPGPNGAGPNATGPNTLGPNPLGPNTAGPSATGPNATGPSAPRGLPTGSF
ncbi:N-acetylmuramoyl-L-alanine amidase [Nocardia sp. alder85J]|uniref:N-acetylmuramoyl-L-alanine amidase n=1 Tax=Nocardia sp. alder85J TaxID=2862949 RepID=UPI00225076B0|nr:N-acetylmuramoyl-L-alanine amidase [Nocardia sp. alder85J]MCX4096620.1 N-acetylmuramoyl-L-alanine amidase [Nocardia sp. alder85J]